MEQPITVKTEVQSNGNIYLFYVDENGDPIETNEGAITLNQDQLQQLQENYILEEISADNEVVQTAEVVVNTQPEHTDHASQEANFIKEKWLNEETEKLLIFFIDNKEAFQNPSMKKKHLWTVACKTMIVGKNPTSCEMKLRNLKRKYSLLLVDHLKNKNDPHVWPYFDLCHQAFHDDSFVKMTLNESGLAQQKTVVNIPTPRQEETEGTVVMKKINKPIDEKVKEMLQFYLQYKKENANVYMWQKHVWDKIAMQLGEDGDFWHKRFYNYKQHYIRMLEKRKYYGPESVVWPYMALYDEIFKDDDDFKHKFGPPRESMPQAPPTVILPIDWNETEKTVLVKYYFDCLHEFQDPSIPNGFLWNEVGRLLDKKPEDCRNKYEQMRKAHLILYIGGGYNLRTRKPIAILFDNIISQEVEGLLYEPSKHLSAADMHWRTEKLDDMVQFLFDCIEMFKDPICHFVCWAAVAVKIQESIPACKEQWNDLTTLYKTILNDKKEDPDLQIDWRYIDIFDRIFDYGMDTKLLDGYENRSHMKNIPKKIVLGGAKAAEKAASPVEVLPENLSDLENEELDEKNSGKRSRGTGDPKQTKILEYYLKYKDKFATSQRKKQKLWEALAEDIGISAEQCAHRFRNLKQVYMAYIQREIDKPDKPILWPYFALCKKVFGYRQIKNKLKQGKSDVEEPVEWTPREIKIVINYFGENFQVINSNLDEKSVWVAVAKDINKTESSVRDKFLDLRKSYLKIQAMVNRNPDCKVNWKYLKFFEDIYSKVPSTEGMEVDTDRNSYHLVDLPPNAAGTELQDEDLQCIIVLPEGQDISNLNSAQIIINNGEKTEPKPAKQPWTKQDKLNLLRHYIDYIEAHKGKFIDSKEMWKEIAPKFNRTPEFCRKSYGFIRGKYKQLKEAKKLETVGKSQLYKSMQKIMNMKPKFVRPPLADEDIILKEQATYTDCNLPLWKVEKALKYYLEHVEEFINPKYDKKYAWINLARANQLPVSKIFRKINYLKQFFNSEKNEVKGEKVDFAATLKEILEKEFICKIALGNIPETMNTEEEVETTVWSDDETEQLLQWYLANLDKFKNPKYVPSYLWMEASNDLNKTALACSQKMTEIRSQYSAMAKENPEGLNSWRFYELCQKIYGTGKKNTEQEQ